MEELETIQRERYGDNVRKTIIIVILLIITFAVFVIKTNHRLDRLESAVYNQQGHPCDLCETCKEREETK